MNTQIQPHQFRPVERELRELLEIAKREHGPEARSTKRISEALYSVDKTYGASRELGARQKRSWNATGSE